MRNSARTSANRTARSIRLTVRISLSTRRNSDLAPSEEPRIDRPDAWADESQRDGNRCEERRCPRRVEQGVSQLQNRDRGAAQRRRQTEENEQSSATFDDRCRGILGENAGG